MRTEQEADRAPGSGWSPELRLLPFAASLAIFVAGVEVIIDWATWIQLNVATLYSLPLVIVAVTRDRRLLWTLAFVLVAVTFGVYVAQVDGGLPSMRVSFFVDRLLAAGCILLSAGILHAWMHSMDRLVQRDARIERQNEALERSRLELQEASTRKTQMLASLSHDIRTPMQAITLLSELLRRTAERPELAAKIPALAKRLQSNAVSVVDFLSEVIDVASFDTGRVSVNGSEFSLDGLIDEQRQRLLSLAEDKGLQLQVEAPPAPVWLQTDRVKLSRIIGNIVGNAIKFTEAGSVTVRTRLLADGAVAVAVADTGCGMKPEYLEQVFGEYAQVHGPGPRSGGGWGLGLAISRRMVRLLGGDIQVESQWGQGSTFSIVLPASCVTQEHPLPG
jgi:signal transduction histidine kinase